MAFQLCNIFDIFCHVQGLFEQERSVLSNYVFCPFEVASVNHMV